MTGSWRASQPLILTKWKTNAILRSDPVMPLHLPTMFVMAMAASVVLSTSLSILAHRRHPDLVTWSRALVLQLIGLVLLSLRGQAPDFVSVVLGNVVAHAGIAMFAVGIYRFDHRRAPAWVIWVPVVATLVGFSLLIDDYRGRMLLGGVIILAQCLHMTALLLARRHDHPGRGQYMLMAAAIVYSVVMAYRLVAVLTGIDTSTHLTDATPLTVSSHLASLTSTLLLSIGALALTLERAQHHATQNEKRYKTLIESATEGILILEDDRARLVNPTLCLLTGHSEAELIGRSFVDFVHPEDREFAVRLHRDRMAGRAEGVASVMRILSRTRGTRWVQVSGIAIDWHGKRSTLNFVTDVTEQREAADALRELAFHDPLTQLPNRRLFMDRVHQALAANARSGRRLAVMMIDLDNFKPLNDTHGHAVGDQLLITVATRLLENLRASDTAARFGGDEFVLLITNLDADPAAATAQARQVGQKVLNLLAEPYRLPQPNGSDAPAIEHRCTGTAGIAIANGGGQDPDALIERADAAMYRAKQAGRNRLELDDGNG